MAWVSSTRRVVSGQRLRVLRRRRRWLQCDDEWPPCTRGLLVSCLAVLPVGRRGVDRLVLALAVRLGPGIRLPWQAGTECSGAPAGTGASGRCGSAVRDHFAFVGSVCLCMPRCRRKGG